MSETPSDDHSVLNSSYFQYRDMMSAKLPGFRERVRAPRHLGSIPLDEIEDPELKAYAAKTRAEARIAAFEEHMRGGPQRGAPWRESCPFAGGGYSSTPWRESCPFAGGELNELSRDPVMNELMELKGGPLPDPEYPNDDSTPSPISTILISG